MGMMEQGPATSIPSLFANSVVGASRPDNLIMTVLYGVHRTVGKTEAFMPGFDGGSDVQRLNDGEVADVVNYVMAQYGSGNPHVTADQVKTFHKK